MERGLTYKILDYLRLFNKTISMIKKLYDGGNTQSFHNKIYYKKKGSVRYQKNQEFCL